MTSRRVTRDGHAYCQGLARILDEAAWDGQTFTRVLRLRVLGHLDNCKTCDDCTTCNAQKKKLIRPYVPVLIPFLIGAALRDRIYEFIRSISTPRRSAESADGDQDGPGATAAAAAAAAGVGAAAGAETHAGLDDYVSQDKSPGGARHPASHGGRKRLRTRERKKRPHLGQTPAASRAPMRISADLAPSAPYKSGSLPANARQRGRDRAESTTHLARKRSLPLPDTRSTGSAWVI
jgi:hypothetical protein